jgi:hypothetical protein
MTKSLPYKSPPYLDENLALDYNHLESIRCFCQGAKGIGDVLCSRCVAAIDPAERARLAAMRPGDGLASAASVAHNQMWRAKKGWRQ